MTISKRVFFPVLVHCMAFCMAFCMVMQTLIWADDPKPVSQLSEPPTCTASIVRSVRTLVESAHVLRPSFNDEISSRGFEIFLSRVDPAKLYYLELDIQEFLPYRTQLDDQIREGSIAFAYVAYKRYLKRFEESLPMIHHQIDSQHDFDLDETIPANAMQLGYSRNQKELEERWRKSIKFEILKLRMAGKSEVEIKNTLHQLFSQNYQLAVQLDSDELLEKYLSSLTNAMDPHTNYKAPQSQERFVNDLKLEMSGIGAALKQVDGATIIDRLIAGGAAEIDGRIKVGDQVLAVGEDDGELPIEIQDVSLGEVVKLIRGKTGTRVTLHVKSSESNETRICVLERSLIRLEEATAKSEIVEEGSKADGTPFRFGYIKLNSFYQDSDGAKADKENYRSATRDLKAILDQLRLSSVDAVILDLSTNDRGALSEAVTVTGLFIDRGPVVQLKSPDGTYKTLADEESGVAWNGPLVVRISQMSTSATEVFAGAIQDYGRGLIVGDPQSHGKGTVQRIVDVVPDADGVEQSKPYGAVKLTVQQFYRPSGKSTQLVGVASDVMLPTLLAKLNLSESDLGYALPTDMGEAMQHLNYGMVNAAIKIKLQELADNRIATNERFLRQQRDIDAYLKNMKDETISLNESTFRSNRSDLNSERVRNAFIESNSESGRIYVDHFYNREVLRVARDYVESLTRNSIALPN